MPRASQPHTPDIDLAARRAYAAEGGTSGVLTPSSRLFVRAASA
ncbi:hypothetical protein [Chelativorans multitrophicus]|nr:hypothetical protein [Chelativorans multitrophicus]